MSEFKDRPIEAIRRYCLPEDKDRFGYPIGEGEAYATIKTEGAQQAYTFAFPADKERYVAAFLPGDYIAVRMYKPADVEQEERVFLEQIKAQYPNAASLKFHHLVCQDWHGFLALSRRTIPLEVKKSPENKMGLEEDVKKVLVMTKWTASLFGKCLGWLGKAYTWGKWCLALATVVACVVAAWKEVQTEPGKTGGIEVNIVHQVAIPDTSKLRPGMTEAVVIGILGEPKFKMSWSQSSGNWSRMEWPSGDKTLTINFQDEGGEPPFKMVDMETRGENAAE